MNRLLNWLHRSWLRHEAANLAAAIHDEEIHYRQHGERMDYWLRDLARVKAEIAFLERPATKLSSGLLAGRGKRTETPAIERFISTRSTALRAQHDADARALENAEDNFEAAEEALEKLKAISVAVSRRLQPLRAVKGDRP